MDNILHLLGLAKRAGRLEIGEEPAGAACRAHKCRVLLLAADAAGNTERRARHFADQGQCLCLMTPYQKTEIGQAVGRGVCAILAVTDIGFAGAIAGALAQRDPHAYGAAAQQLSARAEKADRRRREQRTHEKKLQRQGRTAKPYIPTRIKRAGKTAASDGTPVLGKDKGE